MLIFINYVQLDDLEYIKHIVSSTLSVKMTNIFETVFTLSFVYVDKNFKSGSPAIDAAVFDCF